MSAQEFVHPFAVYYDAQGTRGIMPADQLVDPVKYAIADQCRLSGDLWDLSETILLSLRRPVDVRPHFWGPSAPTIQNLFYGERDPTHDAHVAASLKKLSAAETWTWLDKNIVFRGYDWRDEVFRVLTPQATVRHDIFGQLRGPHTTHVRPSVAIEMIYTHYPEEDALTGYLDASRGMPSVVLFDRAGFGPKYMKIDPKAATIWAKFFVFDGSVWGTNKNKPAERVSFGVISSVDLQQKMEAII